MLLQKKYISLSTAVFVAVSLFIALFSGASSFIGGLTAEASPTATTLYVKPNVSGDCNSWMTACSLQTAIGMADGVTEYDIWVASGVYTPGASLDDSFVLTNSLAIYGGFVGDENDIDAREPLTNVTVLSGDIDGDDTSDDDGVVASSADQVGANNYHVVTSDGVSTTAVLDGFFVTAGNSNLGTGGGIYNFNGSTPMIENVTIIGNAAGSGGGMYNWNSSPILINVIVSGNSAIYYGGGVMNDNSDIHLVNVVIRGNYAGAGGGGMSNGLGNVTLINVTISGNTAQAEGGGIRNSSSSPTIVNSIIWNNSANNGEVGTLAASIYNNNSNPIIGNSIVQGSGGSDAWDSDAGTDQANNKDADPLFMTSVSPSDAPTSDGDLSLMVASPARDGGDNYLYEDVVQYFNTASTDTDVRGSGRFFDTIIDMGAYETEVRSLFLPAILR